MAASEEDLNGDMYRFKRSGACPLSLFDLGAYHEGMAGDMS